MKPNMVQLLFQTLLNQNNQHSVKTNPSPIRLLLDFLFQFSGQADCCLFSFHFLFTLLSYHLKIIIIKFNLIYQAKKYSPMAY